MEEKKTEEQKKQKKATIIIINIIAVVVILSVACYVVFANDEKQQSQEKNGAKFVDVEIEEICENFGSRGNGQRPEGVQSGERPEGGGEMKELMQEICADGEVTEEEKEKWEESQS